MDTKTVYSAKAEKYAKFRWDYSTSAIKTMIKLMHMSINSTVADIGAGTGILTKHFIGKVQKVYAIEPNSELRQILTRDLGAASTISVMNGSAENTGLLSDSINVITVAQAIHWFEPEPARDEIMRILKDGGWLALLRNYGANKARNEVIENLMTEEYGADFTVMMKRPKEQPTCFYFGNGDFQRFAFPFQFSQNWEEFIGSLTTASFMPDEDHPLFGKLEKKALGIFSQYSHHGFWTVEGQTELIIGQPSKVREKCPLAQPATDQTFQSELKPTVLVINHILPE